MSEGRLLGARGAVRGGVGIAILIGAVVALVPGGEGRAGGLEAPGEVPGWLGIHLSDEGGSDGARVEAVVDGSPAEEAGLRAGDLLVEIDGVGVRGPAHLADEIVSRRRGQRVTVGFLRDGIAQSVDVELGGRPHRLAPHAALHRFAGACERRPRLGVQLVELTPELREHLGAGREHGILVSRVLEDTPAAEGDLQVGDVITGLDGHPVRDSWELQERLSATEGRVSVEVVRGGRSLHLDVTLREVEDDVHERCAVHELHRALAEEHRHEAAARWQEALELDRAREVELRELHEHARQMALEAREIAEEHVRAELDAVRARETERAEVRAHRARVLAEESRRAAEDRVREQLEAEHERQAARAEEDLRRALELERARTGLRQL